MNSTLDRLTRSISDKLKGLSSWDEKIVQKAIKSQLEWLILTGQIRIEE